MWPRTTPSLPFPCLPHGNPISLTPWGPQLSPPQAPAPTTSDLASGCGWSSLRMLPTPTPPPCLAPHCLAAWSRLGTALSQEERMSDGAAEPQGRLRSPLGCSTNSPRPPPGHFLETRTPAHEAGGPRGPRPMAFSSSLAVFLCFDSCSQPGGKEAKQKPKLIKGLVFIFRNSGHWRGAYSMGQREIRQGLAGAFVTMEM